MYYTNSQIGIQYHITTQTNKNQKANGDHSLCLHKVVLALGIFMPSQQACPSETEFLMLIIIHRILYKSVFVLQLDLAMWFLLNQCLLEPEYFHLLAIKNRNRKFKSKVKLNKLAFKVKEKKQSLRHKTKSFISNFLLNSLYFFSQMFHIQNDSSTKTLNNQ